MSIELKENLLIFLTLWVGLAYVVLSALGARIFLTIGKLVSNRYLQGKAVTGAIAGSALFLFGCGVHHIHLGVHMIPEGVNEFGKNSGWIRMFDENLIIHLAQAVGAPLLIASGVVINRNARRQAFINKLAEEGKVERRGRRADE